MLEGCCQELTHHPQGLDTCVPNVACVVVLQLPEVESQRWPGIHYTYNYVRATVDMDFDRLSQLRQLACSCHPLEMWLGHTGNIR